MKKLLITGANGFIGKALCKKLSEDFIVAALYNRTKPDLKNVKLLQGDICDSQAIDNICKDVSPDIILHCAAIAHQTAGSVDGESYFNVNCEAAYNLAKTGLKYNPDLNFIQLSTICIYGETNLDLPVSENHRFQPTSDYAKSKLAAEEKLLQLSANNDNLSLCILRLAPVYDQNWHLNLDRRVLMPLLPAFYRVGKGNQRISAVALPNLVDFVRFILQAEKFKHKSLICNVTDNDDYSFNRIIKALKNSNRIKLRPTLPIPAPFVYFAFYMAGLTFPRQKAWFLSCHQKLTSDLIFDNSKMMDLGFTPQYTLETVFKPTPAT